MSAASGIGISKDLSEIFASAVAGSTVRFIKVAIENESLVPRGTTDVEGATLEDDLGKLQTLLEDNEPAYVLARIGSPKAKDVGWIAISYVPDTANVRGKMLYASTRSALTKSLGSAHFSDSLFATSKADITPQAYKAHKAHQAAPQPLSAREQKIADARAAEQAAGGTYEGSTARRNHVGQTVGMTWSDEAKKAVKDLGQGSGNELVLLSIDDTETLVLSSASECPVEELSKRIPKSDPSFAFYAWSHDNGPPSGAKRDIIFIYSCPSSCSVKNRMIYSLQARALHHIAKSHLADMPSVLSERKIETSDPTELNESFLKSELGLGTSASTAGSGTSTPRQGGQAPGFARPKGPGRKR
ncbi:TWF1 [Sanghuangporus vaninii]